MNEYVLSIDFGTGSGRCMLYELGRGAIASKARSWSYTRSQDSPPSAFEFDADEFWQIIATLIRETVQSCEINPSAIKAVSSTSQREGIVLLDTSGREVYAGPNLDFRQPAVAEWQSRISPQRVYQLTGHWPVPMFAPFRLLWIKENRPQTFRRLWRLLSINDWILFRLSGEIAAERTNAVETLLYDIHSRKWSIELTDAFQVPFEILPEIVDAGDVVGRVSNRAADETGLSPGTLVVAGGSDTQSALLGMNVIKVGQIGIVAGSWSPIQKIVDRPTIDDKQRLWTGCHVIKGQYVIESSAMMGGLIYRWFAEALGKVLGMGEMNDLYAFMNGLAANASAGANGVISLLGQSIMNAADWRGSGDGGFIIPLPVTNSIGLGEMARSILEGMAFAIKANLEQLEEVAGGNMEPLRVGGGNAANELWLSILAAVTEREVQVPLNIETSSVGCAICAAVGTGAYSTLSSAAQSMGGMRKSIVPDPVETQEYRLPYERWKRMYSHLTKLNSLHSLSG